MDEIQLALATYQCLVPYLPTFAAKAAEKLGEAVPAAIGAVYKLVFARFQRNPEAKRTFEDLLKDPKDTDLQAAFRVQLKRLLQDDEDFRRELTESIQSIPLSTTQNISQQGSGNIAANVGDGVVSVNQQGGITAKKVIINQTPKPELVWRESRQEALSTGKTQTTARLSVITPFPIGNLYLEVHGKTIEEMHLSPMRSGAFHTGNAGKRDGFAFTNVPQAFGDYQLIIISSEPEIFEVGTEVE